MRTYLLIFCILVIMVAGATVLGMRFGVPASKGAPSGIASSSTSASQPFSPRQAPAGYAEYHNLRYDFSLLYPDSLTVAQHDMSGGAMTITFQNTQSAQGFQIFIVPYAEPQVTQQRFLKDEPSGVRDNVTPVLVDGATAASFDSTDAQLGDTYEVWVIHGGYLYEVTTLRPLDTWLAHIMQTWQFIQPQP